MSRSTTKVRSPARSGRWGLKVDRAVYPPQIVALRYEEERTEGHVEVGRYPVGALDEAVLARESGMPLAIARTLVFQMEMKLVSPRAGG